MSPVGLNTSDRSDKTWQQEFPELKRDVMVFFRKISQISVEKHLSHFQPLTLLIWEPIASEFTEDHNSPRTPFKSWVIFCDLRLQKYKRKETCNFCKSLGLCISRNGDVSKFTMPTFWSSSREVKSIHRIVKASLVFSDAPGHSILRRSEPTIVRILIHTFEEITLLYQNNLYFTKCFQVRDFIWSTCLCLKVGIRVPVLRWITQHGRILNDLTKVMLWWVAALQLDPFDPMLDTAISIRQSLSLPSPLSLFGS